MKNIEASALLWNPEENHYLLISDEQDDGRPGIFILNEYFTVTERLIMQDDICIDDMESISTDGQYIYASSSLSYNKKDELKAKRRKLLHFRYQHHTVTLLQEIDLFDTLTTVKNAQPKSKVAAFLAQAMADHSIDIESHFVKDNALYLGFKAPFIDGGSSAIIKLNDLKTVFAGQKTSAEIWQTIALPDPETGEPTQLSDMLLLENRLLLLSVSSTSAKNSHLWSYTLKDNTAKHQQQFEGLAAEGISFRPDNATLVIVFDEGSNSTSKYRSIKLSNLDTEQ